MVSLNSIRSQINLSINLKSSSSPTKKYPQMKQSNLLTHLFLSGILSILFSCSGGNSNNNEQENQQDAPTLLTLVHDGDEGKVSVFRKGEDEPILVQHAKNGFRPYIHPIIAPDGKGILTEYSPGHHKHQTGLY